MAYCGPRSIPYSHWLGAPPGWDQLSRDAALAWSAYDAGRHTGPGQCGQHPEVWQGEDGTELPDRALPLIPELVACRGCELLSHAHDANTDEHGRLPAGTHLTWVAAPASAPDDDEP